MECIAVVWSMREFVKCGTVSILAAEYVLGRERVECLVPIEIWICILCVNQAV